MWISKCSTADAAVFFAAFLILENNSTEIFCVKLLTIELPTINDGEYKKRLDFHI